MHPRFFHLIGIGGIGMSGLAKILLSEGHHVSGSDIKDSKIIQDLEGRGATIYIGHSSNHLQEKREVIFSSDIPKDNPEYLKAKELSCPIFHRSDELLRQIGLKKGLSIAGTHGKTTTTALLAWVMNESGFDPSVMIGGVIKGLGMQAQGGKGDYFVFEADESDGTFLKYSPFGGIITNIDDDHLNFFGDFEKLKDAFREHALSFKSNKLFWCRDDEHLKELSLKGFSYGFDLESDLRILNFTMKDWGQTFDLLFKGRIYKDVGLPLIGRHNALNAAAVFGLSLELGVDEREIREAFLCFPGVEKRQEKLGFVNGILVIHDYAHHPTALKMTLESIKESLAPSRLVAIFQPHRYSRMKYVMGGFNQIFKKADLLIVTDLYSAGEAPIPGVTTERIVEEISLSHSNCRFIRREKLLEKMTLEGKPDDVLVFFGAGDIDECAKQCLEGLREM